VRDGCPWINLVPLIASNPPVVFVFVVIGHTLSLLVLVVDGLFPMVGAHTLLPPPPLRDDIQGVAEARAELISGVRHNGWIGVSESNRWAARTLA
jgi:hypothetical protein